jgi:hypothetical protein
VKNITLLPTPTEKVVRHDFSADEVAAANKRPNWDALSSRQEMELTHWIQDRHEWQTDINSYVPHLEFRNSVFDLNVLKDSVVLNYRCVSGLWIQLSTKCNIDDLVFLRSLGGGFSVDLDSARPN